MSTYRITNTETGATIVDGIRWRVDVCRELLARHDGETRFTVSEVVA